jgi:hypothetical protein
MNNYIILNDYYKIIYTLVKLYISSKKCDRTSQKLEFRDYLIIYIFGFQSYTELY